MPSKLPRIDDLRLCKAEKRRVVRLAEWEPFLLSCGGLTGVYLTTNHGDKYGSDIRSLRSDGRMAARGPNT